MLGYSSHWDTMDLAGHNWYSNILLSPSQVPTSRRMSGLRRGQNWLAGRGYLSDQGPARMFWDDWSKLQVKGMLGKTNEWWVSVLRTCWVLAYFSLFLGLYQWLHQWLHPGACGPAASLRAWCGTLALHRARTRHQTTSVPCGGNAGRWGYRWWLGIAQCIEFTDSFLNTWQSIAINLNGDGLLFSWTRKLLSN